VAAEEARNTLSELLTRSLVLFDPDSGRYRLHDLLRLVALRVFSYGEGEPDTTADLSRLETAAARHAFHYVEVLDDARLLYLKGGRSLAEGGTIFDRDRHNIRTGQAWAADPAETDENAAALSAKYYSC
jgi:hypothetical protein